MGLVTLAVSSITITRNRGGKFCPISMCREQGHTRDMTASHPRRTAVTTTLAIAFIGVLSACGSTHSTASPSSTSAECAAGAACTASVTLNGTSLTVASNASQTSQTVSAQLVTDQTLHCPSFMPAGGALAIFSSTAPDAAKAVTYTVSGTAGQAVAASHRKHPQYLACFGSPQPFSGYTGADNKRAVFVKSDGLYEAGLFSCAGVDTKPCFTYSESGDSVTLTVQTGPGDPRIIT